MRVSFPFLIAVGTAAVLLVLVISNAVLPPDTVRLVDVRPWLVARATGITAYLMLAGQVAIGLVMSHPTNLSTWKVSKRAFPWHEHLAVFTLAFLGIHVGLLAIDRYADVGILGALVPGMSGYRPPAVAIGTIALYSLLVTAISARWTKLLPRGTWLKIHRLSAVAFVLAWSHAFVAGTDSAPLQAMYLATGLPIVALAAHRWWVIRVRPTRALAPAPAPADRGGASLGLVAEPVRVPVEAARGRGAGR